MPIKKSELYSSIWKSCDELRGGMDASQYKDYVLTLLFVKYVSDKYAGDPDALIEVPSGGSFSDMVAAKGSKEIGDRINKIIGKLADANGLKGVIDLADFNDEDKLGRGQEMVDRLTNLITIFENPALDFSKNRAEGDDLLGDAYEYLMRHFATESGKSKGQFYTPAEVSRAMAKVVGINQDTRQDQTLYDPTCGSGSLLLKASDEAPRGLTIYGQEKDNATAGLAKMNMILHDKPTAEIWKDNTLTAPHFKQDGGILLTVDFAVANPPFSDKAWSNGLDPLNDEFRRFEDGIPPAKNGDYAYLLHLLKSIKSTGKGAIILPHGVLFRGNAEAEIRKRLIRRGVIKGIIGLPANLFYGTGIPACIIVLDKELASSRQGIFMIDASKGFMKDGNKNRLRYQDIRKIVDVFNNKIEIPKYSRLIPLGEIESNDFNLNIPRYIDAGDEEDLQDIEAHLLGGIPERDIESLAAYWQICPTLKSELFTPANRPGYLQLKIDPKEIKNTVFQHREFVAFTEQVKDRFLGWQAASTPILKDLKLGDKPKALIESISEDLLIRFSDVPLVDKYDVYQHLMSYWSDIMQDDVYMIVSDGWRATDIGKPNVDLIPAQLIINRYFRSEAEAVERLEADREAVAREIDEMVEENSGEDSLLEEARNDKGKITKASIKARLAAIKHDWDAKEERKVLNEYLKLIEKESAAGRKAKDAQRSLDGKVRALYARLSEEEVQSLVVDDKWMATLESDIKTEIDRITQALTDRTKQLAERYAQPLPALADEAENLRMKVDEHLNKMGFVWT
ncbi:MAG: N-6 DNA methylase [Methanomicrobiales archaeon]|nr:N-6 DNA methylase [Methanomicrobiales archaeon]